MSERPSLDPECLGRILLLQGALQAAPDETRLAGMVAHGLSGLPGVEACVVCIQGALQCAESRQSPHGPAASPAASSGCPNPCPYREEDGWRRLELRTHRQEYGALFLKARDPEAFWPYLPFAANTANLVALHLENNRSAAGLQSLNRGLDEQVRERTRQFQESQAMLKQILDTVPQSIFWKDKDSVYRGCNQVFARAVGLASSELIAGKTDFDLPWPHAEAEAYRADDAQVVASQTPKRHIVEPLQQADGERLWIDTTKLPLLDAQGQARGVLGVYDDITERKRADEALRASLEEKTALLKEVHHRVKNNLQIVSSLLHMQAARENNPAALGVLQEAQNRVRSMALIHETLYGSQNLAQLDLAAYIETLCAHLFRSFGPAAARIHLDRRLDKVSLAPDQAIPCGLIINELVSNALKYAFPAGQPGRITLELRVHENRVRLRVADNGQGLPPALDFFKTATLGLRLVSNLARQLHGTVTVDRQAGAAFLVVFPLQPN